MARLPANAFFFLFGYDPRYWRGLREHCLIDQHAGVRLIQCLYTPRFRCFNQFAAPGSLLHQEVWEARRPLLIDRGCGGIAYESYPFDTGLLDRYARRLGDRFLGVQFHEWASNTGTDWRRISRAVPQGERVTLPALQEHFDGRSVDGSLEAGDPRDYVGRRFPETPREFARECQRYQQRKLADFGGYLTCVPSMGMAYAEALRWGARVVMPEHGHHIPMGRVHTAAARGAVRQAGHGQFGSYYAPWGNRPDSVTCYLPFTLWYTPPELLCGDAFKHGGNGGSSRAFQRRLFWWAYLTGARYLTEEWGPENTFNDWESFDLTPYGEVVRDFLRFVKQTGRGETVTPAAVVTDNDWFGLDAYLLAGAERRLYFYEPTPHELAVAAFFRALTGHRPSPPNDSACVLSASAMPDAFDVLTDAATSDLLRQYRVLCYVGEHPGRLKRGLGGYAGKLILMGDPVAAAQSLTEATREEMPVRVEGNMHWLLNRKRDRWQLAAFNPHGVTLDFVEGERSDPTAAAPVTISATGVGKARSVSWWPESTRVDRRRASQLDATIGPGGLIVLEW